MSSQGIRDLFKPVSGQIPVGPTASGTSGIYHVAMADAACPGGGAGAFFSPPYLLSQEFPQLTHGWDYPADAVSNRDRSRHRRVDRGEKCDDHRENGE